MIASVRVKALFTDWLDRWQTGRPADPGELCGDCPELEPQLRQQVEGFLRGQEILASRGFPTTLAQTSVPAGAEAERLPLVPGYEILGKLGEGGMGVVYKARQVFPSRLVALKMPSRMAGLFYREVEAVARLEHPHVVRVYAFGEHEGRPYFTMEFVDGGSLQDRLRDGPLPPERAAALAETLARAVHAAHEKGIVHRDLKPANVLMTAGEEPKVSDFGLAVKLGPDSDMSTRTAAIGTPLYMAPEQFLGRTKEIGPRTDVYALGAILYQCLTGRPPFMAATSLEVQRQVLDAEPTPVRQLQPKVSRDLETICLKCLRKEPDQRYASALELADDLRRSRGGESIRARPVGAGERALRWLRKHRQAVALAAAVLLLVAGAVLWASSAGARQYHAARWEEARKLQAAADAAFARRDLPDARRDYLEAGHVYEELTAWPLSAVADSDEFRLAHARLLIRRGQLWLELREFPLAQKDLDDSVATLAAPAGRNAGNPAYLLPQAEAHHALGRLYNDRPVDERDYEGELTKAKGHYEESQKIRRRLYDGDPDNPSYKRDLALSHGYLGDTLLSLREYVEAEREYCQADRLRGELADESLCFHARDWGNFSSLADWEGRLDDAIAELAKRRRFYEDHKFGPLLPGQFQTERLNWEVTLAELTLLKKEAPPQDTRSLLEGAREQYERLMAGDGDHPQLLAGLAQVHVALGKFHARAGDRAAAEPHLTAALDYLKRLDEAGKSQPEDWYRHALVCVWLGRVKTADGKAHTELQDKALDWLEKAVRRGYKHRERLRQELDTSFGELEGPRLDRYRQILDQIH